MTRRGLVIMVWLVVIVLVALCIAVIAGSLVTATVQLMQVIFRAVT